MSKTTETTSAPEPMLFDEQGPIPAFPPVPIDPVTGRLLPMSNEEIAAHREAAIRAIDAISQITDETDTEELWIEGMKDIDIHRPHRKLFEGMY